MDEEAPTPPTTVTATIIPNKDDTGKTAFELDDDDEAAIVIESDGMVAIDVSNNGNYDDNNNNNEQHDQLPTVEEMKARSSVDPAVVAANRARTKKRCLVTLGAICALVLVLVAIIVPVKNNNSNKTSKSSQSVELWGRSADIIDFLYTEGVSPLPALEDLYSAQHRAATFVGDGDVYQAPVGQKLIERYVLSLIYYYFNGPEWTNNFKFLSGRDHCEWFTTETRPLGTILKGVNCNDDGYVTGLDLSDNNLVGKHLPDEISWLRSLKALHVQRNRIGGQIPPSFSKLKNLASLGLMELGLSGTIPSFFGELTALSALALSKNEFYGTIPSSLSKLKGMRLLGLDGNKLTGNITPIKSMTSLEALYMSDNTLTGQIENAGWSRMREFDVSNNMLDGTIPDTMINNQNLLVFDVGHNMFYGSFPQDIKPNENLQYLSFRENAMTGRLSERVAFLSNLKHLDVGEMALSGTIPDTIPQMTNLQYLCTSGNKFTGQPLASMNLETLTNLRDLQMKGNGLSGPLPDWIAEMSSLQLLDLDSNDLTGSIPTWYGLLADLDHLLLNRNRISGSIPAELGNLDQLSVLLLDGNDLTGSANALCNAASSKQTLSYFIADCYPGLNGERPEVECRCCTMCCHDSDPDCNNKQWTADYDPEYMYGYTRPKYSFSLDDATATTFSKDGASNESSSSSSSSSSSPGI
eukprot:CAMPEP_0113483590 /NCGR_PEP_ID=MMETSP0014_2-20120614/23512_1 /TAXON_ID=2857 /ORGANISM="Nitzschia sp." /LENGTH=694 /DNA_ID=CAMNT_0000377141 /DNA_START=147 /DNA_END=2231 /DNA_ORIENTATION=+ /assembly_acc=CAM_ASM_000159